MRSFICLNLILFISFFVWGNPCVASDIQLFVKSPTSSFIHIQNPQSYVPLVAGDTYILKIKGAGMKRMVCKFPNLEKESLIPSGNEFTLDISLPENTGRGNTFYLNIFTQENLAITFNFEVVFRGRIESIQYLAPTVPKHKKNIDIVAPNSFYTLIFEGENMEFAMLNVPRMPYLLNGNFITLHSQTVGFNEKSWLLRIRTGKGEATLTTSLFYFLNKIGIKDKNADMDVPWVRYSIGSGHLINPMLPINPKSHLTDLSMLQLE